MLLRYSPTSPYVRKVTASAHELGLFERLELLPTNSWDPASDLPESNPLGKVPTLVLEGGEILYDSPVICEYLDHLGGGRLFPAPGPARWAALRDQALGDGLLDAAVLLFIERARRPQEERSAWWQQLQLDTVNRALDTLEERAGSFAGLADIGQLTAAVALGYVDFRFAEMEWREGRPQLAAWYAEAAARPALQATVPRDPA
ncbi:MAG TPA: glutathione S-transferase N-terminal domain-containing protein [Gammaproteobacteria bacterium]